MCYVGSSPNLNEILLLLVSAEPLVCLENNLNAMNCLSMVDLLSQLSSNFDMFYLIFFFFEKLYANCFMCFQF